MDAGKRIFCLIYKSLCSLLIILFSASSFAQVQWAEGELISPHGEPNPYALSTDDWQSYRRQGLLHALNWPVTVTGVLIPIEPVRLMLPFFEQSLSLHSFPKQEGEGAFYVPFPEGNRPKHRMGVSFVERHGVTGITFSCAACHSSRLFGQPILGMTNRFPGANELFLRGIRWSKRVSPETFQSLTGASDAETAMYAQSRDRLESVEAKKPIQKSLDTSLAHVALSLSHRQQDEYASLDAEEKHKPREENLRHYVADSKPAVWWNVKYKNKWLSDGSVVAGNPIFTNLLWNEIGRGTDLYDLEAWLETNKKKVEELTTAVYASEAPHITDFFPAKNIKLNKAKQGEKIYIQRCAKCHGHYEKAWSLPTASQLSLAQQLRTTKVTYFADTPVKDVGTDPQRYLGMQSLLQLNQLKISKDNKIIVKYQKGYVPPPLVGIWARFPYLHNNSIPNLCELLKPADKRVKVYYAGEVDNKKTHFDFHCNGYPLHVKTPDEWKGARGHRFDARKEGSSNLGHDFNFSELKSSERHSLIQFLQTL